MSWFKIDDSFYDHPKVVDLTPEAVCLWTLGGTYCARHLTDGVLTGRTAMRLGGTESAIAELVQSGLWEPVEGAAQASYQFHDWLDYQPSREDVLAERAAGKQRAADSRRRKREAEEARRAAASGEPQSNVPTNDDRTSPARSPERSPEPPANVRQDVHMNEQGTSAGRSAPPTRPDPTRPDHSEKPPAAEPRVDVEALFEQAWKTWPKKTDRKDAKQKFAIALRRFKGREEQLVAAVKLHGEAYALHNEPQFRPGLAVWLNKERWENPLPGTPEAGGPGEADGKPAPTKDPNDWMQRKRRVDPNQEPGAPA